MGDASGYRGPVSVVVCTARFVARPINPARTAIARPSRSPHRHRAAAVPTGSRCGDRSHSSRAARPRQRMPAWGRTDRGWPPVHTLAHAQQVQVTLAVLQSGPQPTKRGQQIDQQEEPATAPNNERSPAMTAPNTAPIRPRIQFIRHAPLAAAPVCRKRGTKTPARGGQDIVVRTNSVRRSIAACVLRRPRRARASSPDASPSDGNRARPDPCRTRPADGVRRLRKTSGSRRCGARTPARPCA